MTDAALNQLAVDGIPFILVRCSGVPDVEDFDVDVKAGCGIDDVDQLVCLMLATIEKITGVATDLYVHEVELARTAARGQS